MTSILSTHNQHQITDIKAPYVFLLSLILLCSACSSQPESNTSPKKTTESADDHVMKGYQYLSNMNTKTAIEHFNLAIDNCAGVYGNKTKKIYASRGAAETLFYLTQSAAENKNAIVISTSCADALYLKGYALLDFGRIEEAEEFLKRAIDMSPKNSMYLSELGHIYHTKRQWEIALNTFLLAEQAANRFSPPDVKQQELSRAMRGVGFSLIELGKLDDAEKKFKECLVINKNDQGALQEIEYINHLRKNIPATSPQL